MPRRCKSGLRPCAHGVGHDGLERAHHALDPGAPPHPRFNIVGMSRAEATKVMAELKAKALGRSPDINS